MENDQLQADLEVAEKPPQAAVRTMRIRYSQAFHCKLGSSC